MSELGAARHGRRRAGAVSIFLVVATLLGACSTGAEEGTLGTTAPTTTIAPTTTSRAAGCMPDDRDPTRLEPLMVSEVEGYVLQPDDVGGTGPSDLAKAIEDDGEADAEPVLNGTGFRRGYQRLFRQGEDDALIVFVYEFCDQRGADSYAERVRRVMARGLEQIDVDTGGFADGFMLTAPEGHAVFLWRTDTAHLVLVVGYGDAALRAPELQARTLALLRAQVTRLPGLT